MSFSYFAPKFSDYGKAYRFDVILKVNEERSNPVVVHLATTALP